MARRSSRPDYSWGNFGDVETNVDLTTVVGQFGTTAFALNAPQTLIRVRGRVGLILNPVAVGESTMLLAGLLRMNGDAVVAGSAPELFNNSSDDASWLWQGSLYVHSGDEAAVSEEKLHAEVEVDTKAMRKFKPGEVIAFVFQTAAELSQDQAGTYDLTYYFHCLLQS